jgi:putative two-component system response regulator
MGANDFISKPWEMVELRVRTDAQLRLKYATDAIRRHGEELEERVRERTLELTTALEREALARAKVQNAHRDTLRRLVLAAEFKDRETAAHIDRIGLFSEVLGEALGLESEFNGRLRPAASMHDIGKLAIPDSILGKKGPLDPSERRIMETHTLKGAQLLHGSPSAVLQLGAQIALTHHERWDGAGYPRGLKGEEIPIEGRVCAVADVFDAMTTDRPYRQAIPNQEVLDQMEALRGKHFDPDVFDALLRSRDAIEEIQVDHADSWGLDQTGDVPSVEDLG